MNWLRLGSRRPSFELARITSAARERIPPSSHFRRHSMNSGRKMPRIVVNGASPATCGHIPIWVNEDLKPLSSARQRSSGARSSTQLHPRTLDCCEPPPSSFLRLISRLPRGPDTRPRFGRCLAEGAALCRARRADAAFCKSTATTTLSPHLSFLTGDNICLQLYDAATHIERPRLPLTCPHGPQARAGQVILFSGGLDLHLTGIFETLAINRRQARCL